MVYLYLTTQTTQQIHWTLFINQMVGVFFFFWFSNVTLIANSIKWINYERKKKNMILHLCLVFQVFGSRVGVDIIVKSVENTYGLQSCKNCKDHKLFFFFFFFRCCITNGDLFSFCGGEANMCLFTRQMAPLVVKYERMKENGYA